MKSMIAGTVSTFSQLVIQEGQSAAYLLPTNSRDTPRMIAPTTMSGRLRSRPTSAAA